jgi:hypothetical protein
MNNQPDLPMKSLSFGIEKCSIIAFFISILFLENFDLAKTFLIKNIFHPMRSNRRELYDYSDRSKLGTIYCGQGPQLSYIWIKAIIESSFTISTN